MFWKTQSIPNKVKETATPNKHMKEAGVYQHISQNRYNHFLLTHACNSRPNPSTVFMQVFAVNGILPTSAMPQSHSHSGHTPTSTWGAAWKIALWNLESFIKFFACEKTLASSSASAVMIPTQNSTIRARTGNTIFVLCEKGYSVFFLMKRECDSKGIHTGKKPVQGHAWWPFWPLQHFSLGRAIQPDRTVQGHLFRAALLQNPTSKPSVLTEYSGSKKLSCTQQCNGLPLISMFPPKSRQV